MGLRGGIAVAGGAGGGDGLSFRSCAGTVSAFHTSTSLKMAPRDIGRQMVRQMGQGDGSGRWAREMGQGDGSGKKLGRQLASSACNG